MCRRASLRRTAEDVDASRSEACLLRERAEALPVYVLARAAGVDEAAPAQVVPEGDGGHLKSWNVDRTRSTSLVRSFLAPAAS